MAQRWQFCRKVVRSASQVLLRTYVPVGSAFRWRNSAFRGGWMADPPECLNKPRKVPPGLEVILLYLEGARPFPVSVRDAVGFPRWVVELWGIERCERLAHREREPGGNPGLSRSGMQERTLSVALAPVGWEAAAIRYIRKGVGLRVRRPANRAGCAAPGGTSPRGMGASLARCARRRAMGHRFRPRRE